MYNMYEYGCGRVLSLARDFTAKDDVRTWVLLTYRDTTLVTRETRLTSTVNLRSYRKYVWPTMSSTYGLYVYATFSREGHGKTL